MPAELEHADLKGDARAQRRLLKQHGQLFPRQYLLVGRPADLQRVFQHPGQREQGPRLVRRQVRDPGQVVHALADGSGDLDGQGEGLGGLARLAASLR